MPPDTGMAFVVVQHLDPTHKGMLVELLQRYSEMPVVQIEDDMKVQANHIYTIPPNKDISILHGVLQILDPVTPRGMRLPIDFFLKHLAQDQGEKAIAIILSGMGTDGSHGLRVIKEKLGMVMVQEPESAKFDGMPNSALATGLNDYVASAAQLPAKLVEYARHRMEAAGAPAIADSKTNALQKIIVLLRAHTQQDFSMYKKDTLNRRIRRRMDIHLLDNPDDYVRYLQDNPHELDLLFKEMLIGVTSFFRDPQAYDALKERMVTKLREQTEPHETVRAWVVGCSTGEEAFSIAIVLRECLEEADMRGAVDLQIFATDIDKDAIEVARRGTYPGNIAADVSPERLQRFFVKDGENYRVKKEIRDNVVFAPQNVIMDPPFTKMDLLSCRNLLIYFSAELQQKVLPLFHYSLRQDGILFLGPSESLAGFKELFIPLDQRFKIFQRKKTEAAQRENIEFPVFHQAIPVPKGSQPATHEERRKVPMIGDIAQRVLMEAYTPAAALVDEQGEILFINGRTGKYLEPSPGKANLNIYAMAREGLRNELGIALRKALSEGADYTIRGINVGTNGGTQAINLTVKPLNYPGAQKSLLLVVFEDVVLPKRRRRRRACDTDSQQGAIIEQLESELKYSKERLQETVEQMQATSEELQSANEELQSSNEELQSTNEELTTSKEEMQSLNEELATVNGELQAKVDLLSQVNNDMRNLLNSTQIATLFLDKDLRIRRFTSEATKIIKLIESDVGRPVSDLVSSLKNVDLASDAREVLDTLVFKETQVQAKDGRWYTARMLPYRTVDNVIDGVVLTFIDVTDIKSLQSTGVERDFIRSIVDTVREPLLVLDESLTVIFGSESFYKAFHVSASETQGRSLYELGNGQWDIPDLRKLMEEVLPERKEIIDFRVEHDFPEIGHRKMLLNAREIRRQDQGQAFILLSIADVTPKKQRSAWRGRR